MIKLFNKFENILLKIIYTITSIILSPVLLLMSILMMIKHIIDENIRFWKDFY